MAEALVFVVTTVILYAALMNFPKSEDKENAITGAIINLMLMWGIWVFMAGVAGVCGMKINLYTLTAINVLGAFLIFLYMHVNKSNRQKYYVEWIDVAILTSLVLIAVAVGVYRFGSGLEIFAYESDDSVRHLAFTKELINTGNFAGGRYVMYLMDMIFIKCFVPFAGEMYCYKAFAAADIFLFFMLGAMFWTWIRPMMKGKYAKLVGIGFVLMYFLGYPLNNMLYGFEYLGAGILSINFLLWVLWNNDAKEMQKWQFVVLLMVANTMVFLSYTQFAPAVLIGEAVYLAFYLKSKKQFISWYSLSIVVVSVGVPGLMCVYYIATHYLKKLMPLVLVVVVVMVLLMLLILAVLYMQGKKYKKNMSEVWKQGMAWMAVHKKMLWMVAVVGAVIGVALAYKFIYLGMIVQYTADKGMVADGNIYREPYANFLILAFPFILYVLDAIKGKKNDVVLWIFLGVMVFCIWLIKCIISGSVGTYYLYKMHYLIWLLLYGAAFKQVVSISGEIRYVMSVYLMTAVLFFAVALTGIEKKLEKHNVWLWSDSVAPKVFGIYDYNIQLLEKGGNVNEQMQIIYNMIYEIVDEENTFVPYFGEEARYRKQYYYYLTKQNPEEHLQKINNPETPSDDVVTELKDMGVKYIFVTKDYDGAYVDVFGRLSTVFETEYGSIIALQ